jgi:hypothetical protein
MAGYTTSTQQLRVLYKSLHIPEGNEKENIELAII